MKTSLKYALLLLLLAGGTAVFFVFSHNSGYGYDALEYLVIGRSLIEGYSLYDFIPSKSWGLYALVAGYLSLGNVANHLGITTLITALFILMVTGTFLVLARHFGRLSALAGAILVGLCAMFTEMNYLEPESLVFLSGLAAFYLLTKNENITSSQLYGAGLWLGIGFAFKSVAAFYFIGVAFFLLVRRIPDGYIALGRRIIEIAFLSAGFGTALVVPMVYFGMTDRLFDHIQWTYFFPLLRRPADLFYLGKLLAKLGWFIILFGTALAVSLRADIRWRVYAGPTNQLALAMGLASFLALLKQQASHYAFPGVAFCSLFIAGVFAGIYLDEGFRLRFRTMAVTMLGVGVLAVVSILLYNPNALRRLTTFRTFPYETESARFIRDRVGPNDHALFFKHSTLLYWLSHRYPTIPFLKLDVQETYALGGRPGLLEKALKDPSLKLVEYDSEWPGIQDRDFGSDSVSRGILHTFHGNLVSDFVELKPGLPPYTFWTRRPDAP